MYVKHWFVVLGCWLNFLIGFWFSFSKSGRNERTNGQLTNDKFFKFLRFLPVFLPCETSACSVEKENCQCSLTTHFCIFGFELVCQLYSICQLTVELKHTPVPAQRRQMPWVDTGVDNSWWRHTVAAIWYFLPFFCIFAGTWWRLVQNLDAARANVCTRTCARCGAASCLLFVVCCLFSIWRPPHTQNGTSQIIRKKWYVMGSLLVVDLPVVGWFVAVDSASFVVHRSSLFVGALLVSAWRGLMLFALVLCLFLQYVHQISACCCRHRNKRTHSI